MTNWTFETRIDKRGAVWQMKDKPVCVTEGLTMTAELHTALAEADPAVAGAHA